MELILTRMGGRRALVERLGLEAEDGINELLNQALAYEQSEVPSLTGFLMRARAEDVSVKRQIDSQSDQIRVMTIHGAKGLEAPIVFLPDTIHGARRDRSVFITDDENGPLWNASSKAAPEIVRHAKDRAKQAAAEEENRLLYVAMTRAASWLIVAGARGETLPKNTWWHAVKDGLQRAGASRIKGEFDGILRLSSGDWPSELLAEDRDAVSAEPDIPDMFTDLPSVVPEPKLLSPSSLGGEKVIVGGEVASVGDAIQRGTEIHLLLENLPGLPQDTWDDVAGRLLSSGKPDIDELIGEVRNVIDVAPEMFGPDALAEVELTALVPERSAQIFGAADRVLVRENQVHIVDFKSNATVPERPEQTPEGILRQMGAYLIAAEQIWSDKEIVLEILWTRTAHRMVLPHAIVREAFDRTPIS